MPTFSFGPNESLVRDPFFSVALQPDSPFPLNDNHTPWGGWMCDRFVSFFDLATFEEEANDEETAAFIDGPSPETGIALARLLQGSHSFDGALAFIPTSHAEDFYAHLERFVKNSLSGMGEHAAPDELNLGSDNSDPVSYWGSTTADGLLLLFSTSCDCYDEDWLKSAFECYPRRGEITAPPEATGFDPRFAFFYQDCHLADHLYPDRHDDDPIYGSFLGWAENKGYLRVWSEQDGES